MLITEWLQCMSVVYNFCGEILLIKFFFTYKSNSFYYVYI